MESTINNGRRLLLRIRAKYQGHLH
jgi:hypothetical protein